MKYFWTKIKTAAALGRWQSLYCKTTCLLLLLPAALFSQEEIAILSADSVIVTADWYFSKTDAPVLLLCHQAGYSKGEYLQTGQQLAKLGYNCLAINLRSGDSVNYMVNTTARETRRRNLTWSYVDAQKDMIAAIEFLAKEHKQKIIVVGSSYSASNAMIVGKTNENVKAVAAFSPGEYFKKTPGIVKETAKGFNKPIWVTCSQDEIASTDEIVKNIDPKKVSFFKPKCKGVHGSKALWDAEPCHDAYWKSLMTFLKGLEEKPKKK